jgi:hypothetical protein
MLVCFLVFYRLMGKHLALLTNVMSGVKYFSEAQCLAWKCGTRRSDRHAEPAKPGLMYPLVWIPCCDTVSEKSGSQSEVGSIAGDLEFWVTCNDRQD